MAPPFPSTIHFLVLYIHWQAAFMAVRGGPAKRQVSFNVEESGTMSRRQFDDYDPNEWEEEHKRAERERRKRDAKRHRHDDEKGEEGRDRLRPQAY